MGEGVGRQGGVYPQAGWGLSRTSLCANRQFARDETVACRLGEGSQRTWTMRGKRVRGRRGPTSLDRPLELPSSFSLDAARSCLFVVAVPLQEESPELLPSLSLRSKSMSLAAICTGHTRQPSA